MRLVVDFAHCFTTLWRDKLGQISLAVTTLFWGARATLQFIVLKWAVQHLGLPLAKGAMLQGDADIGIAMGAVLAARLIPLKRVVIVLPDRIRALRRCWPSTSFQFLSNLIASPVTSQRSTPAERSSLPTSSK